MAMLQRSYAVGLALIGLLVLVRILAYLPGFRRLVRALGKRLGTWALDRFSSPPAVDELAEQMRAVIRADRLQADLRRLRRILATDAAMSATRQLANRMAYAWLVDEFARHCREGYPTFTEASLVAAVASAPGDRGWDRPPARYATRVAEVEVLDIGWRR